MESEVCMNGLCGASLVAASDGVGVDYKKGWTLRSGGFANLCQKCGTAYDQLAFCELFHLDDSGWRDCTSCGKPLHCGCIASSAFLELLDNGGITCVTCLNTKTIEKKPNETGITVQNSVEEAPSSSIDKIMLSKLNGEKLLLPSKNDDASRSQMKHEETTGHKDVYESVVQTNLTIGLDASPSKAVEERDMNNSLSYFQQGQGTWSRHILSKSALPRGLNANAGMSSQIRVARPPVEGRIKNQLLPRYWPRITEQELQQISGDSNATIVPLFEKVLSASDAGRIGRLVLPKACAEAYFPPISQPEGLPLRIQDVKGKEWLFQFRFWPNNNSRMYVLEGVTPCIQSMQLQAGDTVTFSRMEPGEKLLMGFRKASLSTSVQLLKGNTYSHINELSRTVHMPSGDVGWPTNEQLGSKLMAGSFPPSMLVSDKKRSRNIGSKSKRFLIESQDTLELIHSWEESQDMLFPPLLLNPTIVTIEDNAFEEYEEPPVFGKGSIFTVCSSGEQEQWVRCDNCSKWRRLPAEFLLPPRWTCHDNVWDQRRAACLAPDELGPRELDNLLRLAKDFYSRRNCVRHKPEEEQGGYNVTNAQTTSIIIGTEPSVAMTTKHPRHRPGCSCIVCIQPPSGKGKHNPTCTCNVCMTVKRRFKTLMLRKKKRQSENEAKIADRSQSQLAWVPKEEAEVGSIGRRTNMQVNESSLDLNNHPDRQEDGKNRVSMMSLLQVANLPLETYLKQNGLTSLITEQQASSGSQVLAQETGETHGGDEVGDVDELRVPDNVQDACS